MANENPVPTKRKTFAHPMRNISAMSLDHGMRVADFGSGSGAYVLAIARELEGSGRVFAIDIQQDLLRRIRTEARTHHLGNVSTVWADLEQSSGSKIKDRYIDRVLISNILFQVEDKKTILREAWRILKTNGRLIVIDWSESFRGMGPIKAHVVSEETARSLAHECGFELLHEFPAGAHHYGLIFRLVTQHS